MPILILKLKKMTANWVFLALLLFAGPKLYSQACSDSLGVGNGLTVLSNPFPQPNLTVTNFSFDWFESGGVSFFSVYIDPALLQAAQANQLKLGVLITGKPKGSSQAPSVLVDALYQVPPQNTGVWTSSEEVFDFPQVGSGTYVSSTTLEAFQDNSGKTVPISLEAKLKLTCVDGYTSQNWQEILDEEISFNGNIDPNIQNIDALSPGASSPQNPGIISEEYPNFYFNSSLVSSDIHYATGEVKFIIYLTEILEGESPYDAINNSSIPFITIREGEPAAAATYPLSKPPLKEGALYGWRIAMRLRGPQDKWIYSYPLFFRYVNNPTITTEDPFDPLKQVENFVSVGDDYNKRLFAALKIILEDNYEIFVASIGNRIPVKGQIRWNGQPYTLEQLEKLAQSFSRQNNSLTKMRLRQ